MRHLPEVTKVVAHGCNIVRVMSICKENTPKSVFEKWLTYLVHRAV